MAFTKVFQVFCIQRAPHIHVKVTAWCRPLLPLRNSGGRLWRRIGDWEGEAGQGCWGVSACTQCLLASALWAVGILPEQCLLTVLAATFPQDHAFHSTTTFVSAWGWVQHLCHATTRCQLFLCNSDPAEQKAVLKYYPWCSQYFEFSDLRFNSDINQCRKIISCCEGGVSAH